MKTHSLFNSALGITLALFACSNVSAKDKHDHKDHKKGSPHNDHPSGGGQSRTFASRGPSGGAHGHASSGPSRGSARGQPQSSGPSRMAMSGPSRGGSSGGRSHASSFPRMAMSAGHSQSGPSHSARGGPSPSRSGPSIIARNGPAFSGPHISPRNDFRRVPPHETFARHYLPPAVPFIRPQFGLSYYGSPRVIEPTYGVSTADVQQALAERGFYDGPIDGDFGPMTQRAIATFQSEAGLPVTGEIDGSLLRALNL